MQILRVSNTISGTSTAPQPQTIKCSGTTQHTSNTSRQSRSCRRRLFSRRRTSRCRSYNTQRTSYAEAVRPGRLGRDLPWILIRTLLQAGRTMHDSSMSRRYEDQPALGSDTSHQQTLLSTGASSVANLGELHKQAAMLSKLPVVSKLLANPEAVDRLSAQSPQLAQMLAANPFLKDMLQPQAVSQLLQAAQDPQSLQNLLGTPLLASIFLPPSPHCKLQGLTLQCCDTELAFCSSTAGHARRSGEIRCQQRCLASDESSFRKPEATQICSGCA